MNLIPPQPDLEWRTDRRFVIHGLDWEAYDKILDAIGDRHIFVTYDRGSLEFMSPSSFHEVCKVWLRRLPEIAAEEAKLKYWCFGSTTLRRMDLDQGLEPDECYYFHRCPPITTTHLDLNANPPPDLALEVDITRSSLDRHGIYAALGISELWRFNGTSLEFYSRNDAGGYDAVERSPTFPWLNPAEVIELLRQKVMLDQITLNRTIRALVRKQLRSKPASRRKKKSNG